MLTNSASLNPQYGAYWDNGNNAVRFTGNGAYMVNSGQALPDGARTVFLVYTPRTLTQGNNGFILDSGENFDDGGIYTYNGLSYGIFTDANDPCTEDGTLVQAGDGNNFHWDVSCSNDSGRAEHSVGAERLACVVIDPNGAEVYADGYQLTDPGTDPPYVNTAGFSIDNGSYAVMLGGRTSDPTNSAYWFDGDIAEVLIYDYRLTAQDHYSVGWYLAQKWDIGDVNYTPIDGDADLDWDVDNVDFGALYGNFTGPGVPTDPNTRLGTDDPNRADLLYDAQTGHVTLDASDAAGSVITTYSLEHLLGLLNYREADLYDFNDSADVATAYQISQTDLDQNGFSGTWDLGNIFPANMTLAELEAFLDMGQYCGTVGTGLFDFDLLRFTDDPRSWSDGDFDDDGDVDNVDFGLLYGNYTGPAAGGMDLQVTPEPATLVLLGFGSVMLLKRRRSWARQRL